MRDLPLISPHGHVEPRLLLDDEPFPDPATLFVPDIIVCAGPQEPTSHRAPLPRR